MTKPPSLITLCLDSIKDQLLIDDEIIPDVYELPSELFNCLLPRLPPLALEKLQKQMPVDFCNGYEPVISQRKRKRDVNFDTTWRALYMSRWPAPSFQNYGVDWLVKDNSTKHEVTDDWHQFYWETHLQNCLDAAAEKALLPSHDGCIGDIKISDTILMYVGGNGHTMELMNDHRKLSYHCRSFGFYARCLRLHNVLCVAEICDLLKSNKLEMLELRWIKTEEHVQGLCKLLRQINGTLASIKFIHCKLSASFINAICDSLFTKGLQTHGIQHFSIMTSSILERNVSSIPAGLTSFLSSGRSLSSLCLCDNQLRQQFAKMVLNTLLDASSSITILDLSENNICGWLSHFKWRNSTSKELSFGIGKSLQSLRVLNLRNNNLQIEDVDCLKYALIHMPNLGTIDLSDNPIEDAGVKSLIFFFVEMSERDFHLVDLRLESCELTCNGATELLEVLSTLKRPLNSLSIGGNDLGNKVGAPLGKFLCTGISSLHVEDVGLGSYGFLEAQDEITKNLKVVNLNISKNRGGIEAAKFLSKLIAQAPELVSVDAGYNFMPAEALPIICSGLKFVKGKLEHLDLTGNSFGDVCVDASLLSKFQVNGKLILKHSSSPILNAPYDDEP